ncbi:hypothetical protein BMS3Abin06_01553 [bacterium BMS3Abin06]|nr:hypothetical protein BMS3Abin06_01553 [bacterium BMS3Abin06]
MKVEDLDDIKLTGALERKDHEASGENIGRVIGIGAINIKITMQLFERYFAFQYNIHNPGIKLGSGIIS